MAFHKCKQMLIDAGYEYSETEIRPSTYRAATDYRQTNLDCIKESDIIFHYVGTTRLGSWQTWESPHYIRQLMKPKAKLICWFDNDRDFPRYYYKKYPVSDIDACIYLVEDNYSYPCPAYQCYMPQLVRPEYNTYLNRPYYPNKKGIALMVHSTPQASNRHTIDNIPLYNYREFNCRGSDRMNPPEYLVALSKLAVSIDDCEGYFGLSRFTMESLLVGTPVVGSTPAVKLLFPKLYTKHKDYKAQRQRLDWLSNSLNYNSVLQEAHDTMIKFYSPEACVKRMIHILKHT